MGLLIEAGPLDSNPVTPEGRGLRLTYSEELVHTDLLRQHKRESPLRTSERAFVLSWLHRRLVSVLGPQLVQKRDFPFPD